MSAALPSTLIANDELEHDKPLAVGDYPSRNLVARLVDSPFVAARGSIDQFDHCASILLQRGPKRSYLNELHSKHRDLTGNSTNSEHVILELAAQYANEDMANELGVSRDFLALLAKGKIVFMIQEKARDTTFDSPFRLQVLANDEEHMLSLAKILIYAIEDYALQEANKKATNSYNVIYDKYQTMQKKLAELNDQIEATSSESLESYDKTQLNAMKERVRFLQVDKAGLIARVKACQEVSATAKSAQRLTTLGEVRMAEAEKLMVGSEIELVGVAAEMEASESLLAKMQEAKKRMDARFSIVGNRDSRAHSLSRMKNQLDDIKREYLESLPLELVDNAIVIQKIE